MASSPAKMAALKYAVDDHVQVCLRLAGFLTAWRIALWPPHPPPTPSGDPWGRWQPRWQHSSGIWHRCSWPLFFLAATRQPRWLRRWGCACIQWAGGGRRVGAGREGPASSTAQASPTTRTSTHRCTQMHRCTKMCLLAARPARHTGPACFFLRAVPSVVYPHRTQSSALRCFYSLFVPFFIWRIIAWGEPA